jgi:hypothetical protein
VCGLIDPLHVVQIAHPQLFADRRLQFRLRHIGEPRIPNFPNFAVFRYFSNLSSSITTVNSASRTSRIGP